MVGDSSLRAGDTHTDNVTDHPTSKSHHVHTIAEVYGWDDHQKAKQLRLLSGQASYELAKELNYADSYRYDATMWMRIRLRMH